MSALIIDYSELQTIATNATSLASKAENYCNELNSNVYSAFGSVTAGVNDVLSSAMYYVAAKQKSLTEKAEEYARFAGNVCTLIEHAKQADQDVATKIENNQEDFLKKHSEIQAAEGIEAFLLNLFVEVKNACPLFEIVADCYIAVFDTLDSAFDALKYFYECGGGKELLNIVIAVAVAVVAVATFIACFPLSLAFSWAGLVALATVIGSGIAAVNAITDVLTSTRALESRLNGDPAWASIYGKQDKFSDVLRDTNFGSGTLNKLSYGAATTIDTVETVCDVICVADMAKDFYKAGPQYSEKLGVNCEDNLSAKEIKTSKNEPKVVKKKPYAKSRPSYAKGQVEAVWENAKDPITGKVYDPTGVEIMWDKTKPRKGQWDMGHLPTEKYSEMHKKYMDDIISKEEFLNWYHDPKNYRPELPHTNRSHMFE